MKGKGDLGGLTVERHLIRRPTRLTIGRGFCYFRNSFCCMQKHMTVGHGAAVAVVCIFKAPIIYK